MNREIAITGVGEVPSGNYPDRSVLGQALDASMEAIANAGLEKEQIDAILPASSFHDSWYNTDQIFSMYVEELGLQGEVQTNAQVTSGGASSASLMKMARGLIQEGEADNVLIVHSEKFSELDFEDAIDVFATLGIPRQWEAPYGINYNAIGGFMTERYKHETGASEEDVASVCVSNREWAKDNPNAMFQDDLTLEEVVESEMIASPLHAYECNVLADGASALVVSDSDIGERFTDDIAYLDSHGGTVTHYSISQEADVTRFGWEEAANKAFRDSDIDREDIDAAQIYDSYPVVNLIALEEMGFVERGEAGKYVREGHTEPGGELPMTTNGGMLSQGHTGAGGGIAVLVECARQLMGDAGDRQIPDLTNAVETAVGGTYMDAQVSIYTNER